jgi:hypothetical protein
MSTVTRRRLRVARQPREFVIEIAGLIDATEAAEKELCERATTDRDQCCGYFPTLFGSSGIVSDLPACISFAHRFPTLVFSGITYRFNFLRLSLVQQSTRAAYHLDSDVETAVTGEVADLARRMLLRLLLNLSTRSERTLHYLDVDPSSIPLEVQGSYVRASRPDTLRQYTRVVSIPPRLGAKIHGVLFPSSQVLHSGLDDSEGGHFVAAYGTEVSSERLRRVRMRTVEGSQHPVADLVLLSQP